MSRLLGIIASKRYLLMAALTCILVIVAAPPSRAEQAQAEVASGAANSEALRKAAQNPVASMISIPFQENMNFGIGPADRTQNVFNIQPVIPVNLTKDWNVIVRWITPIVYQPVSIRQTSGPPIQSSYSGLGDMLPQFYFVPAKKSKVIWGLGPEFLLPTATKTGILGQGKFGMGPTAVLLVQPRKWTLGVLVNNVWSIAGHPELPDVNQLSLQYFVNYNMKKGWYLTTGPTLTANWKAPSGDQWVVPFGGGVGRIMKLGPQPANLKVQFFGNAVHPAGASPWGMQLQIVLLYPKKA